MDNIRLVDGPLGPHIVVSLDWKAAPACRNLPGSVWMPDEKVWMLPASPESVLSTAMALAEFHPSCSEEFKYALGEAERVFMAKNYGLLNSARPPSATTEPWPHQCEGFWFAAHRHASLLAFGMRCGKTYTAKMLIDYWQCTRVLVICPQKVIPVWPEDFEKHGGRRYRFLELGSGNTAKDAARLAEALVDPSPLVVVVNYDSVWRGKLALPMLRVFWDCVIGDEAHRFKSAGSAISKFGIKLTHASKRRLMLTGTPYPNGLIDIFGLARATDPSVFGYSVVGFRANYCVMDKDNKFITAYKNLPDLQRKYFSFTYQVDRAVLHLPPQIHSRATFELCASARKAYRELENEFITEVEEGKITTENALTKCIHLQRLTGGYAETEDGELVHMDTGKAGLLEEVLSELDESEPVVVFCRFHHDIDSALSVAEGLGRKALELSGRRNELKEWQNGEAAVLVVQIQSGKEGVNMSRASHAVFYSLGWSLGEYDQACARFEMSGKTKSTSYTHLVAKGTIDEQIYDALESKRSIVNAIMGIKERGAAAK